MLNKVTVWVIEHHVSLTQNGSPVFPHPAFLFFNRLTSSLNRRNDLEIVMSRA